MCNSEQTALITQYRIMYYTTTLKIWATTISRKFLINFTDIYYTLWQYQNSLAVDVHAPPIRLFFRNGLWWYALYHIISKYNLFYRISTKHVPFTIDLRCTDKYWTRRALPSSPPRLLRRRYYSLSARTLRLRTMTPCRLIHGTSLHPVPAFDQCFTTNTEPRS